ncbi:YadA-like family protein [Trinickia violacea]|uniref:YadA-like family protein n=1 Tax=Trinickia violacea TaxID=2571746 RepID=UPI00346720F0
MGASVDNYGGFAALAIGGSARISDSTIIKMGVRTASGLHMLINVGVGYSW